jgi:4-aminobutyrate aminotransferase-like enzyme
MTRRPPLRGDELPDIVVPPPGPRSRAAAKRVRRAEGAAIWGADAAPIVWSRARGSVVEDLDGNRYVDLTSGFGAAPLGHAAPEVARAVAGQARRLTQGLGDIHPHVAREKLVRRLAGLGGALNRVLLTGTGSEAVELALKTAALVTGRRRVVAFEGGYHGQSGAALEVTHFPPSPEVLKPAGPPRAVHIPYPNPSRCAARRPCGACDLSCLERGWEGVERELRGPDPPRESARRGDARDLGRDPDRRRAHGSLLGVGAERPRRRARLDGCGKGARGRRRDRRPLWKARHHGGLVGSCF